MDAARRRRRSTSSRRRTDASGSSQAVVELSKAFALAVPRDEALAIRDEVAFFQAVKAALVEDEARRSARPEEDLDHAIRQIVAGAIAPGEVIDIFSAAGLQKPDISILSDEFLAEVRELPQRNLAVELLQKLLNDEIKARSRKNLVQARLVRRDARGGDAALPEPKAIETAQVIEELIELAKELRDADRRGEELGLTDDELAFYDALAANESAVEVLGDEELLRHRARAGRDGAAKRDDRLDGEGERPREPAADGAADPAQARLSARQAGAGDARRCSSRRSSSGSSGRKSEEAIVLPFTRVADAEVRPYENAIPLYSLAVAAGGFGEGPERGGGSVGRRRRVASLPHLGSSWRRWSASR